MNEQYSHLDDSNLGMHLERFPTDRSYGIPVLSDPEAILEMYRRLSPPYLRSAGMDKIIDHFAPMQDYYSPRPEDARKKRSPYCSKAEGDVNDKGWKALVYRLKLSKVARFEELPIKKALFDRYGQIIKAETITNTTAIVFKTKWNEGLISEPSGCAFDEANHPCIVSPPVIAMYYDQQRLPHFFYDKRQLYRDREDTKADGFCWRIRSADLDMVSRVLLRRYIRNNGNMPSLDILHKFLGRMM